MFPVKKILVTGATGQIGSELVPALRRHYGRENVLAAGHRRKPSKTFLESGPYCSLDVRDKEAVFSIVKENHINTIYHLASILSARAEENPGLAWDININGLMNALEAARLGGCAFFFPSSIGAFGPETPPHNTPQDTIQRPSTLYGITKISGELLCDYYWHKYGVDTRGLRYPGLVSYVTMPGGGTTDYAVEIFHSALKEGKYECFLEKNTRLDMMYMPDAISAAMRLMEADLDHLKHRNAFNVTAMSITPHELASEIEKALPGFNVTYRVDPVRQAIAESWPRHVDDSAAREEWGWKPKYNLSDMTRDMISKLSMKMAGKEGER